MGDAKRERVEVGGERPVEVHDVVVEHLALAQLPREVDLAAVVHQRIGPRLPGAVQHPGRDDRDGERPGDPRGDRRRRSPIRMEVRHDRRQWPARQFRCPVGRTSTSCTSMCGGCVSTQTIARATSTGIERTCVTRRRGPGPTNTA